MAEKTQGEVIMGRDPVTKVLTHNEATSAPGFDPIFRPRTETAPGQGTIAPYHPDSIASDFMPAAAAKHDC